MAVDATKRPLSISPRFVPYLEKHRIYELFYDITTNLAIRKPKDHILFIRNFLEEIKETRDKPRILILVPPHINAVSLAQFIQVETGVRIISLGDILEESDEELPPDAIAFRLNRLIEKEELAKTGWILLDFPRDYTEGKILQKHGIFPTHTFEVCSSPEKHNDQDAWCENVKQWPLDKFQDAMTVYKRRVFGLKKAFQSSYKVIPVRGRTLSDLAKECVAITKIPLYKGAPIHPRIVLIGTRGSRRRTVARGLKEKYNLTHIDMDELIIQALKTDTEIGEQLRRLERNQVRIYSKIILTMLQQRLLQHDCMKNGWVLTGFPRDINDLRALDCFENPPNKVIFLSIETQKAFKRLQNRRINAYNGVVKTKYEIKKDPTEDIKEYIIHPRDNKINVRKEQEEFDQNFQSMLDYCGENCYVIDAEGGVNEVIERVAKIMTQPGLLAPPRRPMRKADEEEPFTNLAFTLPEKGSSVIYPSEFGPSPIC